MPDETTTSEGSAATPPGTTLFGYTHVTGVPRCPCGDPGDYMMAKQGDGPLDVVLVCWCGATASGTFDDDAERAEFIAAHRRRASC